MRYAAMLIAGFASVASVAAQDSLPITPGQRVRLTLDGGRHRATGIVVSQDSGSVTVRRYPEDSALVIAHARVTTVAVSTGRQSNVGTGAAIGLAGGALIGAMAGSGCDGDFLCPGPGTGAMLGAVSGVFLGGVIGAFSHSETWQDVSRRRVRVSVVAPARGRGPGVGVAVKF